METRQDIVDGKSRTQVSADFIHDFTLLRSASDVRLIGDHEKEKLSGLQTRQCSGRTGLDLELIRRGRRIWLAIANDRFVEHAITIQENSLPQLSRRYGFPSTRHLL